LQEQPSLRKLLWQRQRVLRSLLRAVELRVRFVERRMSRPRELLRLLHRQTLAGSGDE
jgi:hypothetical protein